MSVQLIQQYHAQVEKIIRYGGSRNEGSMRKAFHNLLEGYSRQRNLEMIAELDYRTRQGKTIYPDGTLKDALRQDWGYWESKDEADDLDSEIQKKFAKGYPCNNILFEDTQTAVLYQACEEVARVNFMDAAALDALLTKFVSYESREVREFREAIENFSRDIPDLGEALRQAIREQYEANAKFQKAAKDFLELCQEAINPSMEMADVREMIVQHVLTEDIFITVFDEPQFHRENIIAHELGEVVGTFYTGQVRRQIDARIGGYTQAIKARAAQIYNHQEKQKFLKVLYENFYKAYNPKAADRLGIVYTPNEIVRFMIEAADHLCFKHFGKTLGDPGVEILDPATGTGTFITELIEYLPPHQLEHKYKNELHCNEVAILPYYIANLNIEYTYKQKMGAYEPFENIVFVDTLDNMGFKTGYVRQLGLFGLTDENSERIERQNKRDISVIIGNPPYNAWQENYNLSNPNRPYKEVDDRIRQTYAKQGTAQNQIGLYDNQANVGFEDFLPLSHENNQSIFSMYSNGVKTQRDEWVYDFSQFELAQRMKFFVNIYEKTRQDSEFEDKLKIKWDHDLQNYSDRNIAKEFQQSQIRLASYRPFVKMWLYYDKHFNGRTYQTAGFYYQPKNLNPAIRFSGPNSPKPFAVLATDILPDLNSLSPAADGCRVFALYRYDDLGNRVDNITDWALRQFQQQYAATPRPEGFERSLAESAEAKPFGSQLAKRDIFHYVYAVLHHPAYRAKYKLNLKREFPRIPFYDDFWQWAAWGQQLMQLHLNYETIAPFPLTREDKDPETSRTAYKARLKADKKNGVIELDTLTSLSGIPTEAWQYKLGNRSALEWVLDRYKERKPKDPTIREKFNTYRFADYKEQVIDLLCRVCTVSVETMRIIQQMPDK